MIKKNYDQLQQIILFVEDNLIKDIWVYFNEQIQYTNKHPVL